MDPPLAQLLGSQLPLLFTDYRPSCLRQGLLIYESSSVLSCGSGVGWIRYTVVLFLLHECILTSEGLILELLEYLYAIS